MEIILQSERKASNPGGLACVTCGNSYENLGYLKYCNSSKLKKDSTFTAKRQPIYEALTCSMLSDIGLNSPRGIVIDNRSENANFFYDDPNIEKLHEIHNYYFFSEWNENLDKDESKEKRNLLENDLFFLEMFLIGDVYGKEDNYSWDTQRNSFFYLDLGCNFVDCHGGVLSQRKNALKRLNEQQKRNASKLFKRKSFIDANGTKRTLAEIVTLSSNAKIPIIDTKRCRLEYLTATEILTPNEIEEISQIFMANLFTNIMKKYKSKIIT